MCNVNVKITAKLQKKLQNQNSIAKYTPCTLSFSAREKINDVNLWMKSFLKNIGTLIEEDGEDVLPTQMQPLSIEHFDDYLSP